MTAILDGELKVLARNVDPNIYLTEQYYNDASDTGKNIDRITYEVDMSNELVVSIKPTYEYLCIVDKHNPDLLKEWEFTQAMLTDMHNIPHVLLRQLYHDQYPSSTQLMVQIDFNMPGYCTDMSILQLREFNNIDRHENKLAIQNSIDRMLLFSYRMSSLIEITVQSGLSISAFVKKMQDDIVDVYVYEKGNISRISVIRKDYISMVSLYATPNMRLYDAWLNHLLASQ